MSAAAAWARRIPVSARGRWIALGGALVLALAIALWRSAGSDEAQGYVTERVDRGPIAARVTATGTVNPVTTVQVGTYVSGPIREIDVDFNSPVKKGQRVAKIDPAPFLVKVQRADANLANARASVDKARADLALKKVTAERNRTLRSRNLIAQSDLDTAQSEYQQAQAQLALAEAGVKQAIADLDEARINLGYTEITSPVDGVVVSRNVDVGQTVAASFQTPTLFQIAQDLTKMQVNSNVSESDIGAVREGQPATFTVDAYPGKRFAGAVVQVRNAPTTVQNVVTYDVVVAVDNASLELKPGMTATVSITTDERKDVLRVPLRALRFRPELASEDAAAPAAGAKEAPAEPAVWREDADGKPERVAVQTGLRDDRFAEVLSGELSAGDAVIVALRTAPRRESPTKTSPLTGRPPR